ncbi:hypothetical protein HCN44_007794 [Aphidius gifuensis]|uniref:Uncharacterized protein n=1 Tax=Aphidius gifuensis TaxID=684658 RepID=A0A835CLI1_APHGI|nr:hypothetical protein HCN44_007794 [Aphidius gifuensis]
MKEGVSFEKSNNFDKAHDLYTKGIANAKPETFVFSALYFKRSKIFHSHGLFRDCLADSEQALNSSLLNDRFKRYLNIQMLLSYGVRDKFLMALRLTIIAMKEIGNSIDAMRHKISVIDRYKSLPTFNKFITDALSKMEYDSIYITAPKYSPNLMTHESQSVASCVIMAYFYGLEIKLFKKNDFIYLQTLANDENFLFLVQFIEINTRIANFNGLNMSMLSIKHQSLKVSNAIFAYSNLFPHSCRKMIAHSRHYNGIIIRSTCSIKKSEQVFNNYGVFFDDCNNQVSQDFLKNLDYICKCKVCVDDVETVPIKKHKVPNEDLEYFRSDIKTLQEQINVLKSYLCEQCIVNNYLPLFNYVSEAKIILTLLRKIDEYQSYNTNEAYECIKLFFEIPAEEQVPYVTLQNIRATTQKS